MVDAADLGPEGNGLSFGVLTNVLNGMGAPPRGLYVPHRSRAGELYLMLA